LIKNLVNYIEDKLKKINKIFQKFIGQEKEKIFFEKKIKLDKRKEEEGKKDLYSKKLSIDKETTNINKFPFKLLKAHFLGIFNQYKKNIG
jgi:hypothetical protein